MQYFGYSVNIIFVIVALLLFQRIFLFHVQFVNGMNTSHVQVRNELASEQLIKVQFQVVMSGRYIYCSSLFLFSKRHQNYFHVKFMSRGVLGNNPRKKSSKGSMRENKSCNWQKTPPPPPHQKSNGPSLRYLLHYSKMGFIPE